MSQWHRADREERGQRVKERDAELYLSLDRREMGRGRQRDRDWGRQRKRQRLMEEKAIVKAKRGSNALN